MTRHFIIQVQGADVVSIFGDEVLRNPLTGVYQIEKDGLIVATCYSQPMTIIEWDFDEDLAHGKEIQRWEQPAGGTSPDSLSTAAGRQIVQQKERGHRL